MVGITSIGILFILTDTIAQLFTSPELVSDAENPSGTTVCRHILFVYLFIILWLLIFVLINFLLLAIFMHLKIYFMQIYFMQSSDIRETYFIWQCYEPDSAPMFVQLIIFIYLILLQMVGIILAFQTRKVKINVLNDAKSVTVLIYVSSIVLVVIGLIKFFLRDYINISAAFFSGGILVLATFFLTLIFVPKVLRVAS